MGGGGVNADVETFSKGSQTLMFINARTFVFDKQKSINTFVTLTKNTMLQAINRQNLLLCFTIC